MIAIETKYLGPTNSLGSRIKASTESGHSVTVPYPYERNEGAEAHSVAAVALARKAGWTNHGALIGAATKAGYVFVFDNGSPRFEIGTEPIEIKE
jgi:hypothetical protein